MLLHALLVLAISAPQADTTRYHVTLASSDAPRIQVEATFPAVNGRIWMHPHWASHFPRGWASLVHDLSVATPNGVTVVPMPVDTSAWRIDATGPVTVRYAVDLDWTTKPWPIGNEQGGSRWPDALYLIGRSLFLMGDTIGPVAVTFDLPPGWQATVPWEPSQAARTFVMPGIASLVGNPLILGAASPTQLTEGPFTLTVALPGATAAERSQVEASVRPILRQLVPIFPGTAPSRHLMVYFRSYAEDGEGFLNGAVFTSTTPIRPEGKPVWGVLLAHEMLHFWQGQRVRSNPSSVGQWFGEGGTEYLAMMALVRAGVLDRPTFLQKAGRHLGAYLYFRWAGVFDSISIVQAGRNKGRDRFGVYDGGWATSLCLDARIRTASGDRRSFESLVTAMWEKFGRTNTPWTHADIVREASAAAGEDLSALFRTAIDSTGMLPIADCLATLGLTHMSKPYGAESWLFDDPAASEAARARRDRWYTSR